MQSWNVIFLLDQNPPTKIILLKRAFDKSFAPNMYTGIGGKVEPSETVLESAYRELEEETTITGLPLKQFAKVIIDEQDELVYFWGVYDKTQLPISDDGILEWVGINQIFEKPIIPTTKEMLKKWQSQKFSVSDFTLHVETIKEVNGIKTVRVK